MFFHYGMKNSISLSTQSLFASIRSDIYYLLQDIFVVDLHKVNGSFGISLTVSWLLFDSFFVFWFIYLVRTKDFAKKTNISHPLIRMCVSGG